MKPMKAVRWYWPYTTLSTRGFSHVLCGVACHRTICSHQRSAGIKKYQTLSLPVQSSRAPALTSSVGMNLTWTLIRWPGISEPMGGMTSKYFGLGFSVRSFLRRCSGIILPDYIAKINKWDYNEMLAYGKQQKCMSVVSKNTTVPCKTVIT